MSLIFSFQAFSIASSYSRQLSTLNLIYPHMTYLTTQVIIIVLLAKTPRSEMHSGAYVFGSDGIVNGTGGWNTGLAFLFGLLSVQWTVCLHGLSLEVDLTEILDPWARVLFIDDGKHNVVGLVKGQSITSSVLGLRCHSTYFVSSAFKTAYWSCSE